VSSSFTLPERPGALREPSPKDSDAGRLPNGALLGRYVVTGCVGTGGMGVVYSARDPDLDRNIALKVLRPELSVEVRSRARLLGEARAMAQLSHPNVVPVYDVGMLDDHVFIAMELVDGVTLRHKLDRGTPWRTVVQIYLQAARGLAAAHAAGLVHRDFKPDNVLYGTDGRIRVVDFGLVSADPLDPIPPGSPLRASIGAGIETTAGVVLGTPAFMAPEAMRGEVTDPRADQFSFCVALFHGLYGEYPHTGATLADRAEEIARGVIKRPTGTPVPDRIYRILVHGLRAKPEDRYPSMEALVHALEHAVAPRRRRLLGLGGGVSVIAVIVAVVLTRSRGTPAPPVMFGPAMTIAHSDDQLLEVTMLRDGRYLHIERGIVTVVSADGAKAREIPAPPGVTPSKARASADGWAELRADGASCAWWLVPIDGGAWHPLIDDPSCTSDVDLSPDGTQLAIVQGNELRVRNLATGAERTLMRLAFRPQLDESRAPSWSPDGKRLVIEGELVIVDAVTGAKLHQGQEGAAAEWLDPNRVVYVTRTWLRSEIHVLDLRTGADVVALDLEGNIADLVVGNGGLLVRRDAYLSRAHVISTAVPSPMRIEDLPQLETGSAIDFRTAQWTADGAVITLSMVAGQRGLVRTVPGARGTPLVLDNARNITSFGATATQILYLINDGGADADVRIFDLTTNQVRSWRDLRGKPRPHMTCAKALCVAVDDAGSRWFDPVAMQFTGLAPRLALAEIISPDAKQSARVQGTAIILRDLETNAETPLEIPETGTFELSWGHDARTLIVVATQAGRRRMLLWTDGRWRTLIDEPHRQFNGWVMSPDGSQIALVALLKTSTWSFLPITSQARS
jgi:hypothetical protein